MQEDERIFLYRQVCSKEWGDEAMKLGFPVRMHFDRLKFTYLALSHFRINKHLAQLDKYKASL